MANERSLLSSGLSAEIPARPTASLDRSASATNVDSQPLADITSSIKHRQLLAKDSMSLLTNFSLPTVVGAVLDHLNVSSPFTTIDQPAVKGSAIVGVIMEGYAPNLLDRLGGYLDMAIKSGLVTEGDVAYLASKPEVITNHIKPIMESIIKNRNG